VPGVRFQWGSFLFDGVLESMDETLDLWSADGRPQRSTVAISLAQPGIHHELNPNYKATPQPPAPAALPAGTQPTTVPSPEESLQQTAAKEGRQSDWQDIAAQNGIENPRQIPAGTLLDLQATAAAAIDLDAPTAGLRGGLAAPITLQPFEEAKLTARLHARANLTGTGTAIAGTGAVTPDGAQ
jgi:hypothetical protein